MIDVTIFLLWAALCLGVAATVVWFLYYAITDPPGRHIYMDDQLEH